VAFEQLTPLGELTIRWTGSDEGELAISDEFDNPAAQERSADETADPVTADE
jgi:segregation and condensation protein A